MPTMMPTAAAADPTIREFSVPSMNEAAIPRKSIFSLGTGNVSGENRDKPTRIQLIMMMEKMAMAAHQSGK